MPDEGDGFSDQKLQVASPSAVPVIAGQRKIGMLWGSRGGNTVRQGGAVRKHYAQFVGIPQGAVSDFPGVVFVPPGNRFRFLPRNRISEVLHNGNKFFPTVGNALCRRHFVPHCLFPGESLTVGFPFSIGVPALGLV